MTRSRGVGEASGERVLRGETNFVVSRGRHGLRETEDFFQTAAQHIRRAYRCGMSKLQVLEAISCVLPMTGALTVQIGVRAMQLVDAQP